MTASGFSPPPLEARHFYLRAVTPDDFMYLQLVETSSELAPIGRFRGATPSPERWMQATWEGTIAQFMVMSKANDHPVGTVRLARANFQDGHAHLTAARFDQRRRNPIMFLGVGLFVPGHYAAAGVPGLHADGSATDKFYWWGGRSAGAHLRITGRRLNGPGKPLRAHRGWDRALTALLAELPDLPDLRLLASTGSGGDGQVGFPAVRVDTSKRTLIRAGG